MMFDRYAQGFIVAPGGFGTLDELSAVLTLIQTATVQHFPAILLGEVEWNGMIEWLRAHALADGRVTGADIDGLNLTSDPDEVVRLVKQSRDAALRGGTEPGFAATALRRDANHAPGD